MLFSTQSNRNAVTVKGSIQKSPLITGFTQQCNMLHTLKRTTTFVIMVVFTCGQCNESLKKNQVEKHYQTRCRNCNMLSCVDCGKDFWGDAYKEHIKCISEEEKYSGKNYKPKANANKGEIKQEQWLQKVQTAIDKCVTNPKLKGLLERMKDYPNIPRKKAKFENFVSNSMNVRDRRLVGEVWDVLLANTEQSQKEETSKIVENGNKDDEKLTVNGNVTEKDKLKKLSKEERKAERKRVKNKDKTEQSNVNSDNSDSEIETGNIVVKTENMDSSVDHSEEKSSKKKSKKRKRQDTEENGDITTKKQHIDKNDGDETLNTSTTEDNDEEPVLKKKFNWEETITTVLSCKGEICIKKLKKKVLSEYQAQGGKPKSEERLIAKLNKKITKNPRFIVKKERVKLKSSK